jgi:O-antigen/teichoic acid export membrane protein
VSWVERHRIDPNDHEQLTVSVRRLLTLGGPGLVSMLIHGSGLVFRLAFMLLLLRFSSSAVLGHYALLAAIEVVVIYFAGFEFHTFTTRRYARRPNRRQLHICAASHRRILYASTPLAAGFTLLALALLRVDMAPPDVVGFTIVVLTGVVAQEVIRYMVLVGKAVNAVFVTFLRTAAWQPFVIPFIASDAETLHLIVMAWAIVATFGTVWGIFAMRDVLSRACHPRLRYLLHGLGASRSYLTIAVATVVQGNLERFVLQLLLGPTAVGVFSFFQTLANTLQALVTSSILNISLGRLLSSFGQRLADRSAYLRSVLVRCLLTCLGTAALICIVAVPLVTVTSRPEYMRLLWILPLLLVGQVLTMWTQPIHLALYGAHHDRTLMIVSLAALVASLVVNIIMVKTIGLTGAVLAPTIMGAALALTRWRLLSSFEARGRL